MPDLAARLPDAVPGSAPAARRWRLAVRKKAFFRAFEGPVEVPEDLAGMFERQLREAILQTLGLASARGTLAIGYDCGQGRDWHRQPGPAWRIEAVTGQAMAGAR